MVGQPVPPVRRVLARYDKKTSQFVPCEWTDARGTLLMTVDQAGRGLIPEFGSQFAADGAGSKIVGYRLAHDSSMHDTALFAAWIKAHPKISPKGIL